MKFECFHSPNCKSRRQCSNFGKMTMVIYDPKKNEIWLNFKFKGYYCDYKPDLIFIGWL